MRGLRCGWVVALTLAGAASCGDSESASGAGGSGEGGGGAGAAGTAGAGGAPAAGGAGGAAVIECGPAPHVNVTTTLTDYVTGTPVAGAEITSDLCPGVVLVTDALGRTAGKLSVNTTYTVSVSAEGFIPLLTSEERVVDDFSGGGQLYSTELLPLLPHWSESSPTVLAIVFTDESAGMDCADPSGYVLAVVDHPEAVVTYYGGDTVPEPDPSLTATGPIGAAEISGLASTGTDQWIELTATKDGCDASFVSYPHTGRHRLENGVLTVAGAFVPPAPTP